MAQVTLAASLQNLIFAVAKYVEAPGEEQMALVLRRATHMFSAGKHYDPKAQDQDLFEMVKEHTTELIPVDRDDLRQYVSQALDAAARAYLEKQAQDGPVQVSEENSEGVMQMTFFTELVKPQTLDQVAGLLARLQANRYRFLKDKPQLIRHDAAMEAAFLALAIMDGGEHRVSKELDKILEEKRYHPLALNWFMRMMKENNFQFTPEQREAARTYGEDFLFLRIQRNAERRKRQVESMTQKLRRIIVEAQKTT